MTKNEFLQKVMVEANLPKPIPESKPSEPVKKPTK